MRARPMWVGGDNCCGGCPFYTEDLECYLSGDVEVSLKEYPYNCPLNVGGIIVMREDVDYGGEESQEGN